MENRLIIPIAFENAYNEVTQISKGVSPTVATLTTTLIISVTLENGCSDREREVCATQRSPCECLQATPSHPHTHKQIHQPSSHVVTLFSLPRPSLHWRTEIEAQVFIGELLQNPTPPGKVEKVGRKCGSYTEGQWAI